MTWARIDSPGTALPLIPDPPINVPSMPYLGQLTIPQTDIHEFCHNAVTGDLGCLASLSGSSRRLTFMSSALATTRNQREA